MWAQEHVWSGFDRELEKLAGRRHQLMDGRFVDLDLLEPQLGGRSVDEATEAEITSALTTPPWNHRLGTWMRNRVPFLFDEE